MKTHAAFNEEYYVIWKHLCVHKPTYDLNAERSESEQCTGEPGALLLKATSINELTKKNTTKSYILIAQDSQAD